jgi:Family of unknown function (DUF5825)
VTTLPPPTPLPAPATRPAPLLPDAVPHRLTGRQVVVDEPIRLAAGGRRAAAGIQFLRECLSHDLAVHWVPASNDLLFTDPGAMAFDTGMLSHLPPPAPMAAEPAELSQWRSRYAYGRLYHRRGPGFVTVLDRREPSVSVRLTLDHPDLLATFLTLLEATPLDELSAVQLEAVALLAAERLALVTEEWVVALPPRIRHWPVPCTGI